MENRDYYKVLATSTIEDKGVSIKIVNINNPDEELAFGFDSRWSAISSAIKLIFVALRGLFIHKES